MTVMPAQLHCWRSGEAGANHFVTTPIQMRQVIVRMQELRQGRWARLENLTVVTA